MATINIEQLTDINGNGAFDKLAKAVLDKLQSEFKENRLTGTEYSKVYSTALDSLLAQSMQFLLQKDISANQAELLASQRLLVIAQTDAVVKDMQLTDANILKVNKEIEILDKQSDLMDKQIQLAQSQIDKSAKEIEVLEVQKNKLSAEILLVQANTAQANKQIEVLTAQLLNIPKEGQLLDKQVLKTQSETTYLDQRIKTEKAQILDSVDGVPVAGIIGKQRELYAAQTTGFQRDAEYKVLSKMIDSWSIRRSTDKGTVADNVNRLSDANIGAVVSKVMTGINITPP